MLNSSIMPSLGEIEILAKHEAEGDLMISLQEAKGKIAARKSGPKKYCNVLIIPGK